jgi:SAM-dependent methyltransferase
VDLSTWIDGRFYPRYADNWDDFALRQRVLAVADAKSHLLDIGAGAGILYHMNFRSAVGRAFGIDLDERILDNPALDSAAIGDAANLPYDDCMFDVVVANNVLEHLVDPLAVFAEISRVLRPGGWFVFKTPNRRHYVPVVARLTPHWFHTYVTGLRGRTAGDTFATFYRANTPRAVEQLAAEAGLTIRALELLEGRPEYLRLFWPAYLVGTVYERLVNSAELFKRWRVVMIGSLQKLPGS